MAGAEQIKGSQLVSSCRGVVTKPHCAGPAGSGDTERHPQHGPGAWGIYPLAIAGPKLGRSKPRLDSQISPVTPPVLPPFLFLPLNTRRSPPLLFARATKRGHPFPEVRGSPALVFFYCHGPSNISLVCPVQFCVLSGSETRFSSAIGQTPTSLPQRPPPRVYIHNPDHGIRTRAI